MTPLRIPRDTPGFEEYPDRTPQPVGIKGWAALIRRIWKAWREQRNADAARKASGRIF